MNKKIAIIGISGTGKTTVSKRVSKMIGCPVIHMDGLVWGEDWQEQSAGLIEENLSRLSQQESWIVEGWIDSYSEQILRAADLIIYLDYSGWSAAWGGLQRWWSYGGSKRPELPAGCMESFSLSYLLVMLLRKERSHIENVLTRVGRDDILRIGSRREMRDKLHSILAAA